MQILSKLAGIALLAMALCPMTSAAQRGYSVEELWINSGSRPIHGIMASPDDASGSAPLAIVAHGFNGNMEFGRAWFDSLCAKGYRVFAFDFPSGSVGSTSGGTTLDMSVIDQANDIEAIVAHFRALPTTDTTAIALIGESQGGLASALAATRLTREVSRLVLIYPALCIPDDWHRRYPDPSAIPDTTLVWGIPLGRRFFVEATQIDVFATIGRYDRPVLIVHGDRDSVVALDYSRRAVTTYPDATLKIIAGAGHGFRGEAQKEACHHVATFLSEGR